MKQIISACLAIVLAGLLTSSDAWARGGHGFGGHHGGWGHGHGAYYGGIGLGLGYGFGYYGAPYYAPYYAYPPAVITVPATPPIYIQQTPPVIRQNPPGYWYYCNNPEGYYPYIKECFNGWQQVEPIPSAPR